uniref:Erd4-related membrane protein n=1 Tax=Tetraselmis sp. GSL018 TaxID=582737 RepID=A0A061S9Q7_9CHLO|mmetsp:Transcript_27738/g.65907  ORF Transcript_27738/g.65907 Transcript_27738/m.65907 type:complete len:1084 (+) Transcript_27738:254-3505(+)|eukprot:CAMPEP_0177597716 /NCGR_PEP_ID=MMETSP0419_2-20121207/11879_1 /TAXON_ID=582737 /ORGANISM="Tetraselmis sp., Strain GSL018" /LENGTH=1083 /DNA_ID=CAMNT_0019089943 /DNA_START=247 /DNA_END=3498 /DNA_ORIENTATION=-
MADAKAWFGTFGVHVGVFGGVSLLFGYLRRHALFRRFYAAKRYVQNSKRRKPTKLPHGFFSWLMPLAHYDESDIAEIAGVDALTYLRLLWFGVELFLVITILTAFVIIPVNIAGGAIPDEDLRPASGPPAPPPPPPPPSAPPPPVPSGPGYTCRYDPVRTVSVPKGNLNRITMSNIKPGSDLLWAHLVVCVFLVFYTLRLLWRYNLKCVVARLAYLGTVEPGAEANTVLVQDIPGLRTGSLLDTAMRLVQGPLRSLTPKKASQALEARIAQVFGVGAGLKVPRTRKARETWALDESSRFGSSVADECVTPSAGEEPFFTPSSRSRNLSWSSKGDEDALSLHKGKAASKDGGPVDLPQVVIMLDGKEYSFSTAEAAGAGPSNLEPGSEPRDSEATTDAAPVSPQIDFSDLRRLEKDLAAWPHAWEYLQKHSVEEMVLKYFQDIYGDDVACVNVIPRQQELFPLINKYKATAQKLEDLLNDYSYALKRKLKLKIKTIKVSGAWALAHFGQEAAKVEAIVYYMVLLQDLVNQIKERQATADATAEPAAFVTFRSRVAQTIASTALQDHDTTAWTVGPAPGPSEIVWSNIGMRSWLRSFRSLLVIGAYLSLMLFYGGPVAAIQAWLSSSVLPFVPELFQALIPGIVLKLFLMILPTVLGFLALIRGAQCQSRVQWEMVQWYFPFQVVVVFVFQLFGQLAENLLQLTEIISSNPTVVFELLAAYAPAQAWFFSSYVLVQGLSGRALQILNPVPLVIFWLKSSTAVTANAKARVLNSIFFQYGAFIPYDTINIMLGLVFAVQNPIIPFVVLIYFVTGAFVARYNLLYVYSEQFQSGGSVWPTVVAQILSSLLVFEVFMVGMFSLFQKLPCAIIMLLTIFVTIGFWVQIVGAFSRPQRVMSMKAAANMDKENGVLEISAETLQRVYQPSVMRDFEGGHQLLMGEARKMLDRISSDRGYQQLKALKEIPDPDAEASGTPPRPPYVPPAPSLTPPGAAAPDQAGTGEGAAPAADQQPGGGEPPAGGPAPAGAEEAPSVAPKGEGEPPAEGPAPAGAEEPPPDAEGEASERHEPAEDSGQPQARAAEEPGAEG